MDEPDKLREEITKTRSQLYLFYELTQAMRTSLKLDEMSYIILTGITAHQGLGFNRALLFLVDENARKINGFMGVGPLDSEEAGGIWYCIDEQKMDLYDLIGAYNRIKEGQTPKLLEVVQSISLPLNKKAGILYEALSEKGPLYIQKEKIKKLKHDPLFKKFNFHEFAIAPLSAKGKSIGLIVVDNCVTHKAVSADELKILNMFSNQAAYAIENSRVFEDTLLRSHTDALTSLWNYGYFQYKLDEELEKATREEYSISVLMIDVDNFKKFNDCFGHQAGDEALKSVSKILKDSSRKIDIVSRYGGEEFTLILPFSNKEEASLIGERIRKNVEKSSFLNHEFTVSVGVSSFPHDGLDKEKLIEKADFALYKAKRRGKNRVVLA